MNSKTFKDPKTGRIFEAEVVVVTQTYPKKKNLEREWFAPLWVESDPSDWIPVNKK